MKSKEKVICQVYLDGKIKKSIIEYRVVYVDKKGRYIKTMGNKEYLSKDNRYKSIYTTILDYLADLSLGIIKGDD
jgi:hypothetical protein